MIQFHFDEVKATQAAAELISRNGGHFDHYLLCKCLYVLDRESLRRWGQPVVGGDYRLYAHGPVISGAMSAMRLERRGFYSEHIGRSGNDVTVKDDPGRDELSAAELDLIGEIFRDWGSLNFSEAREKIHAFGECSAPELSGRNLIPVEVILRHCGKSVEEIQEVAQDADAIGRLQEGR